MARRSRSETGARRRAPLILLVDDSFDDRELYASYLAWQGMSYLIAGDGETAVRVAVQMQPDLIVMDLSMPQMNGWDATRTLKRDLRTAHIPVLACTGHAYGAPVERAIEAGCDAYVVKPCLPEDLHGHIRRLLGRTRARRAVP